jgi:hypothetical protein
VVPHGHRWQRGPGGGLAGLREAGRPEAVQQRRPGGLQQRPEQPLGPLGRPQVERTDGQHARPPQRLGHLGERWHLLHQNRAVELVRLGAGPLAVAVQDGGRPVGRVPGHARVDLRHRVQLEAQPGHHPEVPAPAAQGPEQVRMLGGAGGERLPASWRPRPTARCRPRSRACGTASRSRRPGCSRPRRPSWPFPTAAPAGGGRRRRSRRTTAPPARPSRCDSPGRPGPPPSVPC